MQRQVDSQFRIEGSNSKQRNNCRDGKGESNMNYEERLKEYEKEKRELQEMALFPDEYETLIKCLAEKYKI